MTDLALTKIKRKGEGMYGIVYSAAEGKTPRAVKRNLIDYDADFMGSLRELDMLIKLNGHPHVVSIKSITFGDPFATRHGTNLSPVPDEQYKDDTIHFVFEEAKEDGTTFFSNRDWDTLKKTMSHLLLAVEFCHSKGIIHRDIKPSNILAFDTGILKLCDFGLSKPVTRQGIQTPSVVTSWYRAPEILLSKSYNTKVDIWSIGCILYEMVTKKPLLDGSPDRKDKILAILAKYFPDLRGKEGVLTRIRSSWQSQIKERIPKEDEALFTSLLEGLLSVDLDKRFTASQALDHSFFDPYREYITNIRELFPPVPDEEPVIKFKPCTERDKAGIIIRNIFKSRDNYKNWYKHRTLFQAISLFDRYLLESKIKKGKIRITLLTCLYVAIKYFTTMSCLIPFSLIYGDITQEELTYAEKLERYLIDKVLDCYIYRPTLYEAADMFNHQLSDKDIEHLIRIYTKGHVNGTSLNGLTLEQGFKLCFP